MTHSAASPPAGPRTPAPLPIGEGLHSALALLRRAYDCARDADAALWDFAVEIDQLHAAGLTITDLRWLVVKGYAEHGGEMSMYGDVHRSFARSRGLKFLATTCVVLTKKGAALVSRILAFQALAPSATPATAAAGGDAQRPARGDLPGGNGHARDKTSVSPPHVKPQWNPLRRELSLGGITVKRFRVPADNQEIILRVFEDNGWPEQIDDPLPQQAHVDPQARLHDAIKRLNRKQANHLLRFHGNGTGTGIAWSLRTPAAEACVRG
jgi:hypothetical protein